ncbi:Aste57867_15684 [Aphanomyces stellatus]|uniref:Aste57867_15684 protein n=1 Tax=Aphanomyces stellatus TaxID=120398 RepID=A0A485L6N6_9STRA|nr:hypothetical protein As57867_015628 [Aphanomyces stellatus]VFT92477.1 Aste57867_15684 [Aphanomyces stellatus]
MPALVSPTKKAIDDKTSGHGQREPAIVVVDVKKVAYSSVPTPHEVGLSQQLLALQTDRDVIEKRFEERILDLEAQLQQAARRECELLDREQRIHRAQIEAQNAAVLAERAIWTVKLDDVTAQLHKQLHDKETHKQWHDRFHQHATTPSRHPLADDVFARFGQSIALLPSAESPHVVRAGCLDFLAAILRETTTDTVLGPVLIGLLHLSLYRSSHPNLAAEIVRAGTLPPLVHICDVAVNPAVLAQATRLLASLASCPLNKTAMAAKQAVRAMTRLLTTYERDHARFHDVLHGALAALANLAHESDILRTQIVNSGVVPCLARLVSDDIPHVSVRVAAAHALANLGFAGVANQGAIVMAQGDVELTLQLRRARQEMMAADAAAVAWRPLARRCAVGLANLASTPVNQIAIGYSDAIPTLLQLLVDGTDDAGVLEACGLALGSLCYQCKVNKVRVAAHNGLSVLLYVLASSHRYADDVAVLAATCLALASVVAMDANLRQLEDLDGHLPLLSLCAAAADPRVMETSAMAVAALAPSLEYKHATVSAGKPFKVQEAGGSAALERVATALYAGSVVPRWLQHGLAVMRATPKQLEQARAAAAAAVDDVTNPKSDEAESVWDEVFTRDELTTEELIEMTPDVLCGDFYNTEDTSAGEHTTE